MRINTVAILVVLASVVIGCATPYQKYGITGGFSEVKLSDSAYRVEFSGNGYATKERVHIFWLYRCAELTVEKGYDLMVLRTGQATSDANSYGDRIIRPAANVQEQTDGQSLRPAVWRPDIDAPLKSQYAYYYTTTITTWASKGTVLMYRNPLPEELVWAIDARALMEKLAPYVKSDGRKPAPPSDEGVRASLATHETVSFLAGEVVRMNGDVSLAQKLRGSEEVIEKFRDAELGFHELFRERKRIEGTTKGGRLTLSLTITPNGVVSEVRVIDSTFNSPGFVEAIRSGIKKIQFAPKNVAPTTVSKIVISIQPSLQEPVSAGVQRKPVGAG